MAPRCSVFIATSLDGFIARTDGRIDWLDAANASVPPGEDCGFKAFFDTVDALVMGRKTFDLARTFEPWPYGKTPVVVATRGALDLPAALRATVSASAEAPDVLLSRLAAAGAKHVYVDGGQTVQRFLDAGLVDTMTITLIPVLLGSGIPLFGAPAHGRDTLLALQGSKSWDFGYVQLTYRVLNGARGAAAQG